MTRNRQKRDAMIQNFERTFSVFLALSSLVCVRMRACVRARACGAQRIKYYVYISQILCVHSC